MKNAGKVYRPVKAGDTVFVFNPLGRMFLQPHTVLEVEGDGAHAMVTLRTPDHHKVIKRKRCMMMDQQDADQRMKFGRVNMGKKT